MKTKLEKAAYARQWYNNHRAHACARRREIYHQRREIPVCPRCQDARLKLKPNGEPYALCEDCRQKQNEHSSRYSGKIRELKKICKACGQPLTII